MASGSTGGTSVKQARAGKGKKSAAKKRTLKPRRQTAGNFDDGFVGQAGF